MIGGVGGVRALRAWEGLVKNSFQSLFLGPYGNPHAYKCQGRNIFKDFNLSIRLSVLVHCTTMHCTSALYKCTVPLCTVPEHTQPYLILNCLVLGCLDLQVLQKNLSESANSSRSTNFCEKLWLVEKDFERIKSPDAGQRSRIEMPDEEPVGSRGCDSLAASRRPWISSRDRCKPASTSSELSNCASAKLNMTYNPALGSRLVKVSCSYSKTSCHAIGVFWLQKFMLRKIAATQKTIFLNSLSSYISSII